MPVPSAANMKFKFPAFLNVDDASIEFAIEKHLHQSLTLWRPGDKFWVVVLGKMRIFERDPSDLAWVHAVVVGEKSTHPGARCLRIGSHANPLARKVGDAQRAALRVVSHGMVLAAP